MNFRFRAFSVVFSFSIYVTFSRPHSLAHSFTITLTTANELYLSPFYEEPYRFILRFVSGYFFSLALYAIGERFSMVGVQHLTSTAAALTIILSDTKK